MPRLLNDIAPWCALNTLAKLVLRSCQIGAGCSDGQTNRHQCTATSCEPRYVGDQDLYSANRVCISSLNPFISRQADGTATGSTRAPVIPSHNWFSEVPCRMWMCSASDRCHRADNLRALVSRSAQCSSCRATRPVFLRGYCREALRYTII